MYSKLYVASRLKNTLKGPENGCFLTKTTVFHGPSGETRTRGILVPKAGETFFLILSSPFPCFPLRCPLVSEPLVSTVSRCSGPVYGLICGQTLIPDQVRQFSLPPAGKAFPFPGPLYLRRTGYATVFRRAMPSDFGTPETKNTDFRTA